MKRAIAGSICGILLVLIFSQQGFCKGVVVANPSTTSTVYVRPDPTWEAGQALGNFLGAMIQRSNALAAEKKLEQSKQETQEIMNNIVRKDTEDMTNIISQKGLDFLWGALDQFIYEQGQSPYKNISDGIATMSFMKDLGEGEQMFREYSINMNTQQCRSIFRFTRTGQEAISVMPYMLPEPQQPEYSEGGVFGWAWNSQEKVDGGGWLLNEIFPGGLADLSGIQKGDIVTKLDTYSVADNDVERLSAYIGMRLNQKAIVKVTVLRDKKPITFAMQL